MPPDAPVYALAPEYHTLTCGAHRILATREACGFETFETIFCFHDIKLKHPGGTVPLMVREPPLA
jgi:hypothetical protein